MNLKRKFWEELIDNFPLIRHVPHRKQKKTSVGEYRHTDVPLPSNEMGSGEK
jgi:hypothetical protein